MQNALWFLMKKKRVLSLWVITFDPLKKEKKNYQWKKNLSFSSEIWGHFAFTFCRYCPQIWKMKNLFRNQGQFQIKWQCSRNCPPKVFCPQIWKTKNNLSLQKSREITVYFSDEVFSLSMPLVCPHLTTVRNAFSNWFQPFVTQIAWGHVLKTASSLVLIGH